MVTEASATSDASARAAPELAVILPTFNERANLPIVTARIAQALAGIDWEIVIVDDNSPDGTGEEANRIAAQDRRIRCIHRIGRRGLAGACIEGMLATPAKYVAVMDADLQHDEALLARMLATLRDGKADLAVASRFAEGAVQAGLSANRDRASRFSIAVVNRFLKVDLTDPMSGFFMLERRTVEELAPSLSTQGFKILLDIVATARGRLRVAEFPFTFGQRQHGDSKLDSRVALDFAQLLLAKFTDDAVSFRFVLFCIVGLSGVGVHMAVLAGLHDFTAWRFDVTQAVATVIAIAWNFVFNNAFTYRDQRLTGWRYLRGLVSFEVICAIGAISNVGIASLIYGQQGAWWLAGLSGALMGAVWNYTVSAAFVWRAR
ncbi:MAG: glycosyltransferase [Xanthobacteraceae bacterium]|uniref:glycosyltransferase n=1 Tax=Pseudolabrys sp. TaxID=1960880 RepID=UPI003D0F52E8